MQKGSDSERIALSGKARNLMEHSQDYRLDAAESQRLPARLKVIASRSRESKLPALFYQLPPGIQK